MISKNEYELLKKLRVKEITVDEAEKLSKDDKECLQSLKKRGLINCSSFDSPYVIISLGNSAIEEYEQNVREEARQIEANQIAKESLNKATRANRIAIVSIIIAALSFIFSVIIAIIK